jgi:hypothetical protein
VGVDLWNTDSIIVNLSDDTQVIVTLDLILAVFPKRGPLDEEDLDQPACASQKLAHPQGWASRVIQTIGCVMLAGAHIETYNHSVTHTTELRPHDGRSHTRIIHAPSKQGWIVFIDLHDLFSNRRRSAKQGGVAMLRGSARLRGVASDAEISSSDLGFSRKFYRATAGTLS